MKKLGRKPLAPYYIKELKRARRLGLTLGDIRSYTGLCFKTIVKHTKGVA